eukprot:TRINITY_DN1825_c0_g1_i1.p1 TRINITY_DN1825_c0_g1~~TRINITY_DN1825_c0_g1_i1.p1  ORF type:complete len:506 (-),score=101.74 TRINITY_DN1825_c0_g1_i1:56-1573(-)
MKYLYLLLSVISIAFAGPLGDCLNGRAVPLGTFPSSGGQCGIPYPAPSSTNPVYRASINEAAYESGAACGSCYELTGPTGVITVVIADKCAATANRCGGDRVNFVVEQAGFNVITNSSVETDVIYDLGYRLVTCPYSDDTSIAASKGAGSTDTFFQVAFYNSRYPIDAVAILANGMKKFEQLTRNDGFGTWRWNQQSGGAKIVFPVQFSLVSDETNQVLFYTVYNAWSADSTVITFSGSQFADVVDSNTTCPQAIPPALLYNDGQVGYGWDGQSGNYKNQYVNLTYPGSAFTEVTYVVQAGMYSYSGVQFTRLGGFNALYYSNLTFSIYSDQSSSVNMLVYLTGNESLASSGQTVAITNTPQTFTLNVSSLAAGQQVIYAVAFQVNQEVAGPIQVFYSNLSWGINAENPQTEIPPVADSGTPVLNTSTSSGSTTGGKTPIIVYTTSGFSFSDSEAPSTTAGDTVTTSPTSQSRTTGSAGQATTSTASSVAAATILVAAVTFLNML